MTNEQIVGAIVAFILTNGVTVFAVARWGVARAIAYTHLERDVKELQKWKLDQEEINRGVAKDLKGLSMKIDARVKEITK